MLTINFQLQTTANDQKRVAYDSLALAGDIGGLSDFLIIILRSAITFIVSNRFSYIVLRSLFMVNRSGERTNAWVS